jgi:hypothetical protein
MRDTVIRHHHCSRYGSRIADLRNAARMVTQVFRQLVKRLPVPTSHGRAVARRTIARNRQYTTGNYRSSVCATANYDDSRAPVTKGRAIRGRQCRGSALGRMRRTIFERRCSTVYQIGGRLNAKREIGESKPQSACSSFPSTLGVQRRAKALRLKNTLH